METSPIKTEHKVLRIKPLIVKKGNIFINNGLKVDKPFKTEDILFKEDILYDTTDMYFLKGEFQRLLLVNRYNVVTRQSRAIAKYYSQDGSITEKTSDKVTEVLGQEQFKTIFTALCSILDQELKIRSILALLTADKKLTLPIDVKEDVKPLKILMENSSQTDEMRIEKLKPKKRNRKPVSPYIVQDIIAEANKNVKKNAERGQYIVPDAVKSINKDVEKKKPKRVVINVRSINSEESEKATLCSEVMSTGPYKDLNSKNNADTLSKQDLKSLTLVNGQQNFADAVNHMTVLGNQNLTDLNTEKSHLADISHKRNSIDSLPDLGHLNDDFSNDSLGKFSALSDTPTHPELLRNPALIFSNIDQHTKEEIRHTGFRVPGTNIVVRYKPEDMFHIATKDNLQYLDNTDKKKLLQHQLTIDYENCLTPVDEDGNLPIHLAVLNNDAELLVRHCIVLKLRGSTIDLPEDGLTALKLAIATGRGALAASLVRHGACPLRTDAAHRTCMHDAAEKDADVLTAVLTACKQNARKILYENEDLWKPEMEKQTDEELARHLLKYICCMFNKQGYNPLMLASMLGLYENVRVLLAHCANVNDRMPTCGNTALYLALAAASNSSIEIGNKSKVVDRFRQTIELLLQNGADPSIENNYGTNVHSLLQETNNSELSMLVANRPSVQSLNKQSPVSVERDIANVMLVLGRDGDIQYKTLENERKKKRPVKKTDKFHTVEDVVLKPGNTDSDTKKIDKTEMNSKNIKVFQIRGNVTKVCPKGKVGIPMINKHPARDNLPKICPKGKVGIPINNKNPAVKRKQTDTPVAIKQAKIDK